MHTLLLLVVVTAGLAAAEQSCPSTVEERHLSLDSDGGAEAMALAQRHQRALLAPRAGGGRGAPVTPLPPIGFVKTHKTGGSTMVNILHRLADARNLTFPLPNDHGVINWNLLETQEPSAHQFDLICNHEMFNETAVRAYLKPSAFLFSIVRDPVNMTDSRFRWQATTTGNENAPTLDSWAARLEKMAENRGTYANPMARDMGWYDGVDTRNYDVGEEAFLKDKDPKAVGQFIQKIDNALDCVFPTERYDDGLILLGHKLHLGLDDLKYLKMKESAYDAGEIPPPTQQEREQLKEFLSVDQAIYDHFIKRFEHDWEASGGDSALRGEVDELRRRNDELARACEEPRDKMVCPEIFTIDTGKFDRMLLLRNAMKEGLPEISRVIEQLPVETMTLIYDMVNPSDSH